MLVEQHAPSPARLNDLPRTVSRSATVRIEARGRSIEVLWGQPWQYLTAAYWVAVTEQWRRDYATPLVSHKLGSTFEEEVVACLLGGFGISLEMNLAALRLVREAQLVERGAPASALEIAEVLHRPLPTAGPMRHYRFPNQRASRIASALQRLREEERPTDALAVRDWLLTFHGIGPKTASWIVRNYFDSSEVAIIDIHVFRAGVRAGLFAADWSPARDYSVLEAVFLQWAAVGGVPAADLDAVIWMHQAAAARAGRRPVT